MNAVQAKPPQDTELQVPSVSWRGLWAMAWPLVLTQLGMALMGLVDITIAARLGAVEAAALGPAFALLMVMGSFVTALSVGLQALVARAIGAGRLSLAIESARKCLFGVAIITLLILPFLFLLTPWAYASTGAPSEVVLVGSRYFRGILLGMLPLHLWVCIQAVLRAAGKVKAILSSQLVDVGISLASSLGMGWALGWGLDGMALGYGLGKSLALWRSWVLLRQADLAWPLKQAWAGFGQEFYEIWRVGWPAGAQVVARNVAMLGYFGVLNLLPNPAATTAAFSAAFRMEAMAFMPIFALNLAAASLVGRALGAKDASSAKQATWRLAFLGSFVLGLSALAFISFAEPLAAWVGGPDREVQAMVASYLRIAAVAEPLLAFSMVINGALQGAGATHLPMMATLLTQVALRWPLAWALAVGLQWGADGAWAAIPISLGVQSLILLVVFWRGDWARVGLHPAP